MDDGTILLIDGGSVYPRIAKTLGQRLQLTHVHGSTAGLEFANGCFNLNGVIIDLVQGTAPNPSSQPSMLSLWIVDQLREFSTCSQIPIAVVSHWSPQMICSAAKRFGIEDFQSTYDYFQMSDVDSMVEFFKSAPDTAN